MPMCLAYGAFCTPYSPPFLSQKEKKMKQEKGNSHLVSMYWLPGTVLAITFSHFFLSILYLFIYFFGGGWGGCGSDAKNGIDWSSVRLTLSLIYA